MHGLHVGLVAGKIEISDRFSESTAIDQNKWYLWL